MTPKRARPAPEPKSKSKNLTIGLCVIARDEERFIGDCLESARRFVQEIVVVDTGSGDRTVEIAREHGARVEHFTWSDDFAAARNAAIDASTTDWILMLDADERLLAQGAELLAECARMAPVIPDGINGFCPAISSGQLDGHGARNITRRVMRLFPRMPGLRWVGAIHEDLVYQPQPLRLRSIALDKLRVIHYGYDSTVYLERGKDDRNTRLLEHELALHPRDPRTNYFLGQQHLAMRRYAESIPHFRVFLEHADQVPGEFTIHVFAMLITALASIGDLTGVDEVAQRGEEHKLLSADARGVLATVEERRHRLDLAERHLLRALQPGQPVGIAHDEGTGGWSTRLHLARIHELQGRPQQALEDIDAAFPDLEQRQRGLVSMEAAALALRFRAVDLAELWIQRAKSSLDGTMAAEQRLMELRIELFTAHRHTAVQFDDRSMEAAAAAGDWQRAYDAVLRLETGSPASSVRLMYVADALKRGGAPEAALDILNRLIDDPQLPRSAYWLLVSTLTQLGRYGDAETTLELMRIRGVPQEMNRAA